MFFRFLVFEMDALFHQDVEDGAEQVAVVETEDAVERVEPHGMIGFEHLLELDGEEGLELVGGPFGDRFVAMEVAAFGDRLVVRGEVFELLAKGFDGGLKLGIVEDQGIDVDGAAFFAGVAVAAAGTALGLFFLAAKLGFGGFQFAAKGADVGVEVAEGFLEIKRAGRLRLWFGLVPVALAVTTITVALFTFGAAFGGAGFLAFPCGETAAVGFLSARGLGRAFGPFSIATGGFAGGCFGAGWGFGGSVGIGFGVNFGACFGLGLGGLQGEVFGRCVERFGGGRDRQGRYGGAFSRCGGRGLRFRGLGRGRGFFPFFRGGNRVGFARFAVRLEDGGDRFGQVGDFGPQLPLQASLPSLDPFGEEGEVGFGQFFEAAGGFGPAEDGELGDRGAEGEDFGCAVEELVGVGGFELGERQVEEPRFAFADEDVEENLPVADGVALGLWIAELPGDGGGEFEADGRVDFEEGAREA